MSEFENEGVNQSPEGAEPADAADADPEADGLSDGEAVEANGEAVESEADESEADESEADESEADESEADDEVVSAPHLIGEDGKDANQAEYDGESFFPPELGEGEEV